MSTNDDMCANCGKGEECSGDLKSCTACKLVKYCNRDCQIAHRPQHKKACKTRAAELYDEALFREPPPQYGECPICCLLLPCMGNGRSYMTCCGKIICNGCHLAPVFDNHGKIIAGEKCPFCRTPQPTTDEEAIERLKKRTEVGDTFAFFLMGVSYYHAHRGFPQDRDKAMKLWHKAGKFAYNNIGAAYALGDHGVERDEKMARHYYEVAAMEGCVMARNNLGAREGNAGNYDRALKHYMIAVRGGDNDSVKYIKQLFLNGHVTKDDYAKAIRSHQAYLVEIKSDQRDKAAAVDDTYKYYDQLHAAELYDEQLFHDILSDDELFEEPPPPEVCRICVLPLPLNMTESCFKACCGKLICNGCIHAMKETEGENMKICPFCMTPDAISEEEEFQRVKKLTEKGNANAFCQLGGYYEDGAMGLPQDWAKANESWLKAGELGCADAYYNLGIGYKYGDGVEIDMKKAKHYYELAAMNGSVKARYGLGDMEGKAGNLCRAVKHFLIAARAGHTMSLDVVKGGYMDGFVTKDQYANTLRAYQKSQDEMKSDMRDIAAAEE